MITIVVVSMLPPYARPAASGPRSEFQYGSFRTSPQRGSPTDGLSITSSLKRWLDPCNPCIGPPATHAGAFRFQAFTLLGDRKPPLLDFPANSRPAPVQP
jgi:hypothetical protein